MKLLYVAGVGCRRGCDSATLHDLLVQCLHEAKLSLAGLIGLATLENKRDEVGISTLAEKLNVPLYYFSVEQLAAYRERLLHPSAKVLEATGSASVAEAAALALAESLLMKAQYSGQAILLIPKTSNAAASVAVAAATMSESLA